MARPNCSLRYAAPSPSLAIRCRARGVCLPLPASQPLWQVGGEPQESLRAPGRSAGGCGHHQGSLSGLTASSLWRIPWGLEAEPGSGPCGPFGELWSGGDGGLCHQPQVALLGATETVPANGTVPKWRGGEGCKPKLHQGVKLLYVLEEQGPHRVADRCPGVHACPVGMPVLHAGMQGTWTVW